MLAISILFHVSIVLFFTAKVALFPSEPIVFQSAIKVDLVALPDKAPESVVEPKPTPKPAEPKPAVEVKPVAEKPKPTPKPIDSKIDLTKQKQSKALEQLKALKAVEEEMKKAKEEANRKAQPIKGNVLAAGTSPRGIHKLEYDNYIGEIDNHVKQNWALPEWLAKAGLRARVRVRINEQGYIEDKRLVMSSGNNEYDALAIQAVERSSPFPAPPEKFVNLVGIDGIIFQFPD